MAAGGARDGAYQSETFSAGTDAVNLERARGFKSMVDAAGQRWPEGWVRGEGFVRPNGVDPMRRPPRFDEIGEEYVRQIVDLSPGQRKRYLGQLRVLAATHVKGELVFTKPVTSITEADLRAWLLSWDRSVKTKSLPRPDPRRLRLRDRTGMAKCEPDGEDGAEGVACPPVASRAAVPHRSRV